MRGLRATMLGAAVGAAMMVGGASTAAALTPVPQLSVWTFTGNCIDCAAAANAATYKVTATLTLWDYIEGTALGNQHFASFFYDGSNLMLPYEVFPFGGSATGSGVAHQLQDGDGLTGLINGTQQSVYLKFGDGLEFTLEDGNFYTCGTNGNGYYDVPCSWQFNSDYGTGSFALPGGPPSTTVPEPSTYALMAAGLGALLVVRRRRSAAA